LKTLFLQKKSLKLFEHVQLILLILIVSCKKDTPQLPPTIEFMGITPTDFNGNFIGQKDSTDWGFQDNWHEKAFGFFNNEMRVFCPDDEEYEAYPATPNPILNTEFRLDYWFKDSADLEIRIVDRNYNLLK